MEKQKREKRKETGGYSQTTVVLSLWRQCVLAPCCHVAACGRLSTCFPGGQVASSTLTCSPSLSPSPSPRFPDRARSLASPQDRRRAAAVLRASPSTPATSGQAEATTRSAVTSSPSLLRESSRDGLVLRRRPLFLPRRPELRRDAAVVSEPLRPRRGYPRNQGELVVLLDMPFLLLSRRLAVGHRRRRRRNAPGLDTGLSGREAGWFGWVPGLVPGLGRPKGEPPQTQSRPGNRPGPIWGPAQQ